MSTLPELLRRRLDRSAAERGFTLLEVMVAVILLAIISLSLIPLLVSGLRASRLTKLETEAKNLTVARINSMRALPFHVAYQNGPFIDLLDEYYTNATASSTAIPATSGTGLYVPSGTVPGQTAATSYYQVTFGSPPEPAGFSQVVYSQFIIPNTQGSTGAITASGDQVMTPASSYNSQATGVDQPPTLTLAVTVVTSFTWNNKTHLNRAFTEITDTGNDSTLVQAESGANALNLSTVASDGSQISGVLGQLGITATLSNESTSAASVLGGQFTRVDPTGVNTYPSSTGVQLSADSPPDPATPSGPLSAPMTTCSWNFLGPTSDTDVSSTVANAQPRAPYDVESGSPAPTVGVSLLSNDQSACADTLFKETAFAFTDAVNSGDETNAAMAIPSGAPMLAVPDATGTGSLIAGADGNVDTPALAFNSAGQILNPVTSEAAVSFTEPVDLFPSMPFISTSSVACPSGTGYSCTAATGIPTDNALLVLDLTGAQVSCSSQGSGATGSYAGTLFVWEQPTQGTAGSYVSYPLGWSSSSGSTPTLPSLSTVVGYTSTGTAVPLSTYISSWSTSGLVQEQGPTGDHTIPGAISLITAPTLQNSSGSLINDSAINLQVARLTCVSMDNR